MHCKRIINPDKKSGCGWASVKYKGKKLDAYKATYMRKCQQQKDAEPSDGLSCQENGTAKLPDQNCFLDDADLDAADSGKKEMSPPPPIKRMILPYNTVNNRNLLQ